MATQDTPNRQIILITDGLPTAHFEAEMLYLLYPPDPRTEEATMREGAACKRDGITINLFLLPSWSQSSEDIQFSHRLAENTGGRVFFTAGKRSRSLRRLGLRRTTTEHHFVSDAWLLYGANGYTGRLIAREAVRRGMRPILAGRDRRKIEPLADELKCESRAFDSIDAARVAKHLDGVKVVLNCAGPFVKTSRTLIAACLEAKASYCDITGEIDVIEHAASCDEAARAAGVSIMPSVGFDVVPTDCLAAILSEEMPDATHLALAFTGSAHTSPGTTKTIVQGMPFGGKARDRRQDRDGAVRLEDAQHSVSTGTREAVTIPWGDVASAFYTTGIPNIETYMALSKASAREDAAAPQDRTTVEVQAGHESRAAVDRRVHQGPDRRAVADRANVAVGRSSQRRRPHGDGDARNAERLSAHGAHGRRGGRTDVEQRRRAGVSHPGASVRQGVRLVNARRGVAWTTDARASSAAKFASRSSDERVDQVLDHLLPAAVVRRHFALVEHVLFERREAAPCRLRSRRRCPLSQLAVALLDDLVERAVGANRGGDLQAAGEGVHAADVGVEQIDRLEAFAADLGVEVHAARGEAAVLQQRRACICVVR